MKAEEFVMNVCGEDVYATFVDGECVHIQPIVGEAEDEEYHAFMLSMVQEDYANDMEFEYVSGL